MDKKHIIELVFIVALFIGYSFVLGYIVESNYKVPICHNSTVYKNVSVQNVSIVYVNTTVFVNKSVPVIINNSLGIEQLQKRLLNSVIRLKQCERSMIKYNVSDSYFVMSEMNESLYECERDLNYTKYRLKVLFEDIV